jgi:hypothetical protein
MSKTTTFIKIESPAKRIEIVDEETYHNGLTVQYEVEPGKEYFLLYCEYTTGNSFGRDPEPHYEYVDLYKTREEAQENLNRIAEHYRLRKRPDKVKLKLNDGKNYELWPPWTGYFEELNYVEVAAITTLGGTNRIEF